MRVPSSAISAVRLAFVEMVANFSGPVAGLSKRAESRVQQCENALWFLMTLPEVQDAVRRHSDAPLPSAPSARLDRIQRAEWWTRHPVLSVNDLLAFAHESDVLNGEDMGFGGVGGVGVGVGVGGVGVGIGEELGDGLGYYHEPGDVPRALDAQASRNAMGPSLWQLVSAAIPDEGEAALVLQDGEVVVADGQEQGGDNGQQHDGQEQEHEHDQDGQDRSGRVMPRFTVGQEDWPYGEERKRKRGKAGEGGW